MSSSRLYRLSGLTLLLGEVLSAILTVVNEFAFPSNTNGFDPKVVTAAPWQIVNLLLLIGGIVMLLGLPGIYLRQAKQTGTLGLIGFTLLFVSAILFTVVIYSVDLLVIPWLATNAPKLAEGNGPDALIVFFIAASLLLTIGALLFSIATLRAAILPRLASVLILVGVALNLLGFAPFQSTLGNIIGTASPVAIYLALAWYGYALVSMRTAPAISASMLDSEAQPA